MTTKINGGPAFPVKELSAINTHRVEGEKL